jgi:uncharacterized protein DUF3606
MPDDKTKVGEPDRSRVSADQDYEVRQLAEKHGLSPTQIRELIARVGNDREQQRKPPRNFAACGPRLWLARESSGDKGEKESQTAQPQSGKPPMAAAEQG